MGFIGENWVIKNWSFGQILEERNWHSWQGNNSTKILKEKGGKAAQISNDTRWNSKIAMLANFVENHPLYLEILTELDEKPNDGENFPLKNHLEAILTWFFHITLIGGQK